MPDPALTDTIAEVVRASEHDVAAVYLFGSRARGTERPDSDVDVGVLLQTDPPKTLDGLLPDLHADLERRLRLPVQVVVLNHAPPDLVHRVMRDGVIVLENDKSHRIRFEVRSRNLYWDILPMLRRYREAVLND